MPRISFWKPLIKEEVMIMTATLRATAAIAIRMINEENDLDLLKAILRTIKSSVFKAVG